MAIASYMSVTPQGPTYAFTAALSSPTAVQVASGYSGYAFYSTGSNATWVGYGTTAAQAVANAVIPTSGNPQNSFLVIPGYVFYFSLSSNLYFAALTTVSTATVYVQSVM